MLVLMAALFFALPILADNNPPACTLSVSPASGTAPLSVKASGSCAAGSNSDGNSIVQLSLKWGDGSAPLTSTESQLTAAHTYNQPGSFNVVLTGTDSNGNTGSASQLVTVTAAPPPPPPPPPPSPPPPLSCQLSVSPGSGPAPLKVTANSTCSDAAQRAVSVVVSFGDGFYLPGASATHTYTNPGIFNLSVLARDAAGNTSGPLSQTITVSLAPTLFVGISNGQIAEFDKSGKPLKTLDSGLGGSMTGMAFDSAGNLYATNFTADTVSQFNPKGSLLGTFGSAYNCKPESIVFDSAGNAYVGETGCSHALLKFDAYGHLAAAYPVATEQEGSDWVELAPDGCTLFYTSQGSSVLRFDACRRRQLPPFSSSLKEGLALRLLPDGGLLVANLDNIVRLDFAGRVAADYVASGEKCWAALTLDSDGSSFWAADYCTSDVARFDISSGNELFKFNTGTPANTLFGIAERSPAPVAITPAGPLLASPSAATVSSGQSASYTLTFTPSSGVAGQALSLSCANLPLGSTCSFSPDTLAAGNGAATINLTIATTGPSARLMLGRKPFFLYGLCLPFALVLVPGSNGRRKRCTFVAVLLILLSVLFACSGARSTTPISPPSAAAPQAGAATPAGTYTILVRVHGSAMESSTVVQLNVQ